jgi:hypothetical protein
VISKTSPQPRWTPGHFWETFLQVQSDFEFRDVWEGRAGMGAWAGMQVGARAGGAGEIGAVETHGALCGAEDEEGDERNGDAGDKFEEVGDGGF